MKANRIFNILIAVVMLISVCAIPATAAEDIAVLLNGEILEFDVPPQIIGDRTMVPMRKIFEALGAEVQWDGETQTIYATRGVTEIVLQIGNCEMMIDSNIFTSSTMSAYAVTLDVPPLLVGDRTLVPVRAVAEGLDADVQWDGDARTVIITKEEGSTEAHNNVTAATKPARYPKEGILYGYGDDGIAELQYNTRYLFEQKILPRTIFEYEKETIEYINALNSSKMKENILGCFELAAANVILNDLELSGEAVPENEDQIWALVDEKRPEFGLGNEHIVDIKIEKLDEYTNAIIIELLDTNWTMLSTYIGIAYSEAVGLQYYTLERSIDFLGGNDIPYMFCHIGPTSRGSIHFIENDRQTFINAIRAVM